MAVRGACARIAQRKRAGGALMLQARIGGKGLPLAVERAQQGPSGAGGCRAPAGAARLAPRARDAQRVRSGSLGLVPVAYRLDHA